MYVFSCIFTFIPKLIQHHSPTDLAPNPTATRTQDPAALLDLKKQRVRVDLDLPSNAMSLRLKTACEGSHADGSRTARSTKEFKREGANDKGLGGGDTRGGGSAHEAARRSVEGFTNGRNNGGGGNGGGGNEADGVPRVRGDTVRSQSHYPKNAVQTSRVEHVFICSTE